MHFDLDSTAAKLNNVNNRSERHGEDLTPAVDLALTFDAPNTLLSEFDGRLLGALYFDRAGDSGQETIDGLPGVLPNLRFPQLHKDALKWDLELAGCEVIVEHDHGKDIVLSDCKANGFTLRLKEGGTVTVGLRVQCASTDLTVTVLGKLAQLVQHDVRITLSAGAPGEEGNNTMEKS